MELTERILNKVWFGVAWRAYVQAPWSWSYQGFDFLPSAPNWHLETSSPYIDGTLRKENSTSETMISSKISTKYVYSISVCNICVPRRSRRVYHTSLLRHRHRWPSSSQASTEHVIVLPVECEFVISLDLTTLEILCH